MSELLYAGVEAGGTKVVCLVGSGPDAIVADTVIPTTTPAETIVAITDFFAARAAAGIEVAAGGIASFGPVELRRANPKYGWITTTPKPAWSDTDLLGPIRDALGVPVGFDSDVNGAALGERRWGAAQGLETFVYLTVGTGIGGGAVVGGRIAHGLVHAEMGHLSVPRHPDDDYPGRCPFHGACLEGMAAGPAVEERWGTAGSELSGAELRDAVALEAFYLAAGLRSVVYTLAPERIVIGGGVSQLDGLFPAIRAALFDHLAGYPGLPEQGAAEFVVPAGLGSMAGPAGALVLADMAHEAAND